MKSTAKLAVRRAQWLRMRPRFGALGPGSYVGRPRELVGGRHVLIGAGATLRPGVSISAYDGFGTQAFTPRITLGDRVILMTGVTLAAAEAIEIHDDAGLGENVLVIDHQHGYRDPDVPFMRQPLTSIRPVVIGERTWVGRNVVVMPGTRLGKHCVVGANSVVSGEWPDHTVLAGTPARPISHYDAETGEWVRVPRPER